MPNSTRPLYIDNPKRPYSWTGDLDPPSPLLVRNGSLKMSKEDFGPRDLSDLYIRPDRRRKSSSDKHSEKSKREFHSPHPVSNGSKHNDVTSPYFKSEDECSRIIRETPKKQSLNSDKKRSKFSNLRRKSPPTTTSHVSEFEYFSLSEPPPGMSSPIQIYPKEAQRHQTDTSPLHCPIRRTPSKEVRTPSKEVQCPIRRTPSTEQNLKYEEKEGEKCRECLTRVPYATLIATILCCVGVGVFCGTMYRGTTLTLLMFEEVFRIKITWVEPVQLTFLIIGAAMGGLGLMILFLGCLSTGATRAKLYSTWRGRVGGRVSCALFMGITYLLSIIWLLMFGLLVIVTVFYTLAFFQCQNTPENQCIDYNQFEFLFPSSTTEEDRRVCRDERKMFCKDCVNNAEVMFLLATGAAFIIVVSLIHYLMCLSANYAHIKDQEKFIDLKEIQYLQDTSEMSTLPKDRF